MNLNAMVRQYAVTALWSSIDEDGEPLDAHYTVEDIDSKTMDAMRDDCADFLAANRGDLVAAGMNAHDAGHDFWLTRNGHGAGFWDRGLGEIGDRLSDAAKVYGSVDLYVGDDGQITGC
jgi:hypothetical protein